MLLSREARGGGTKPKAKDFRGGTVSWWIYTADPRGLMRCAGPLCGRAHMRQPLRIPGTHPPAVPAVCLDTTRRCVPSFIHETPALPCLDLIPCHLPAPACPRPASALAPPGAPQGTGGFGAVYEAGWRGRQVAVKKLPLFGPDQVTTRRSACTLCASRVPSLSAFEQPAPVFCFANRCLGLLVSLVVATAALRGGDVRCAAA